MADASDPSGPADLYRVEPSQFTEARNRLVKRLKADGQRAEADQVAKLRRPPLSAWALNQVAHTRPELVEAVLATGDSLRSAMENALGGDASGLRAAQSDNRRAIDSAAAAAGALLEGSGHPGGGQATQRMIATLGAAVVDEAVASQLRDGVLDADRSAPGFGLDAALVTLPTAADAWPRARGEEAGQADDSDGRTVAELEDDADRLAGRATRLRAEADQAEQRALRARTEADEAERQAEQARGAADEAGRLAAEAREAAQAAVRGSVRKRS